MNTEYIFLLTWYLKSRSFACFAFFCREIKRETHNNNKNIQYDNQMSAKCANKLNNRCINEEKKKKIGKKKEEDMKQIGCVSF